MSPSIKPIKNQIDIQPVFVFSQAFSCTHTTRRQLSAGSQMIAPRCRCTGRGPRAPCGWPCETAWRRQTGRRPEQPPRTERPACRQGRPVQRNKTHAADVTNGASDIGALYAGRCVPPPLPPSSPTLSVQRLRTPSRHQAIDFYIVPP